MKFFAKVEKVEYEEGGRTIVARWQKVCQKAQIFGQRETEV
jgi:hypothetical protein